MEMLALIPPIETQTPTYALMSLQSSNGSCFCLCLAQPIYPPPSHLVLHHVLRNYYLYTHGKKEKKKRQMKPQLSGKEGLRWLDQIGRRRNPKIILLPYVLG